MEAQMKRGFLEACVLAAVSGEESYGYQIVKDVPASMGLTESTLYPLLKRLEKAGCITARSAEHDGAVARVDLGCEHGRVEARSDKANARKDNTRGNEPARHGEVDLLRAGHGTHSFLRREMRGSAALLALTLPEGRGGLPRPESREARNLF